jgi:hypothetical protein
MAAEKVVGSIGVKAKLPDSFGQQSRARIYQL